MSVVADLGLQIKKVMSKNNKKFRKNIRLKNYDYKTNGAYFVTICTNFKRNYINKKERSIIEQELMLLQKRFPGVIIDFYAIMPNHVHSIIFLESSTISLSRIIQTFKSITTLQLKKSGFNRRVFWQRNFYEHVIRNDEALKNIREYVMNNPIAERINMEEIYGE